MQSMHGLGWIHAWIAWVAVRLSSPSSPQAVEYEYDLAGQLIRRIFPEDGPEEFSYDGWGALVSAKNAAEELRFERDAVGRPGPGPRSGARGGGAGVAHGPGHAHLRQALRVRSLERAGGGLGSSSGAHPLRVRPRRAAARLAPEQRQHQGDVERRAAACIRPRPRFRGALQLRRRRQPLRRRGARVRRRQPATAPRQPGLLLERGRPALGETSAHAFRRRGDALSLERRGPAAHGRAPRWSHGELRLGFAYDPFARRVHKRVEAPPDREGRRAVLDTTRFFWDGQ